MWPPSWRQARWCVWATCTRRLSSASSSATRPRSTYCNRAPVRIRGVHLGLGYQCVFRDVPATTVIDSAATSTAATSVCRNLRRISRVVHAAGHQPFRREKRGSGGPTRDLRLGNHLLRSELNQLSRDVFERRAGDINPGH